MDTAFKVGYSLVVAIMIVLAVILGTQTFYDEPKSNYRNIEEAQRYEEEKDDYHRNVFILANVIGVAAVAAGLFLFRRVEAMPLGLLLGGIGVVIFGWVQSAEADGGAVGEAPLFVAVAVGLAIVLGAGYWFLRERGGIGGGQAD